MEKYEARLVQGEDIDWSEIYYDVKPTVEEFDNYCGRVFSKPGLWGVGAYLLKNAAEIFYTVYNPIEFDLPDLP